MPGTNPDALETWSLEPLAFEHLLERLAEYQRVVLLSGDVHNSTGNLMSYWRGDAVTPARIAQFTSSGMKNVMPVYLRALDRSAMLLQELLRARIGVERFGWDRPADDLVLLPEGRTEDDLVAATRAKLLRSPVLLPGPRVAGRQRNPAGPAGRADHSAQPRPSPRTGAGGSDRCSTIAPMPSGRRRSGPRPIDDAAVEAQLADPEQVFAALQTIAARHQSALDRMRNARQMLFRSNFGVCRFVTEGGEPRACRDDHGRARAVHPGARPGDADPGPRPLPRPGGPARPGRGAAARASCGSPRS